MESKTMKYEKPSYCYQKVGVHEIDGIIKVLMSNGGSVIQDHYGLIPIQEKEAKNCLSTPEQFKRSIRVRFDSVDVTFEVVFDKQGEAIHQSVTIEDVPFGNPSQVLLQSNSCLLKQETILISLIMEYSRMVSDHIDAVLRSKQRREAITRPVVR